MTTRIRRDEQYPGRRQIKHAAADKNQDAVGKGGGGDSAGNREKGDNKLRRVANNARGVRRRAAGAGCNSGLSSPTCSPATSLVLVARGSGLRVAVRT